MEQKQAVVFELDNCMYGIDIAGIDDSVVHEIVKKENCLWIILKRKKPKLIFQKNGGWKV